MKISNLIYSFLVVMLLASCQDDEGFADFDAGQTNTLALSGEWYVRYYDVDGTLLEDYHKVLTYNTAANDATIWVQDSDYLGFQAKATANVAALSFSATDSANILEDPGVSNITIVNGKIYKDLGETSVTKTVVDSISFQVEDSAFPGDVFIVAGHQVSGFLEDEH